MGGLQDLLVVGDGGGGGVGCVLGALGAEVVEDGAEDGVVERLSALEASGEMRGDDVSDVIPIQAARAKERTLVWGSWSQRTKAVLTEESNEKA